MTGSGAQPAALLPPGFEYRRVGVDGVTINCAIGGSGPPVLLLHGYPPLSIWQEYATDVRGEPLPTGHFLPEEAPPLVTAALRAFLTSLTSLTS
jgi:pimeloyl-ACP methyl ester carboxylesterase